MTDTPPELTAGPPPKPVAEPIFNVPWPVTAIIAAILLAYAVQTRSPDEAMSLALFPQQVVSGHYWGLLTSLFLHGSWAHALMNAAFALAFGVPVARLFGPRPAGVAAFFIFYLLCGVLAGLAFVVANLHGSQPVVGASGAVAGLMGAAARLMETPGRLGSPFSRTALAMAAAWILTNALVSLTGIAPGSGGAPIAWQAHLGGFAAGLVLVGPFHRLLRR
jgi:membrane associated rhomboid family serine protease